GTITALHRSVTAGGNGQSENLTGLLQTDAGLQRGNSGGPLIDSKGRVIGMNTAAVAGNGIGQGTINVGFAIPINEVRSIVTQMEQGKATSTIQLPSTKGYMGVGVVDASKVASTPPADQGGAFGGYYGFGNAPTYTPPARSGAVVSAVEQGSPADAAGIVVGDEIVSLNGTTVTNAKQLTRLLSSTHPGSSVTVGWLDPSGQSHSATLRLVTGPAT
ncbi:MAG: S1C family serine protease, partial [Acidimicrobiales bacterium]